MDESGAVVSYSDYYPFGLEMGGRTSTGDITRENFTGHELDDESEILYAGARYYDPLIGRWPVVDPMDDLFPSQSPYNYVVNNPLLYIDPTGNDTDQVKQAQVAPSPVDPMPLIGLVSRVASGARTLGGAGFILATLPFTFSGYDPVAAERNRYNDGHTRVDEDDNESVTIYKAPRVDGQKLLEKGFLPEDFPRTTLFDGNAYFAGPEDRQIAEAFAERYGEGVLEVNILKSQYDKVFKPFEQPYLGSEGGVELRIPRELFPILNTNFRMLKPR